MCASGDEHQRVWIPAGNYRLDYQSNTGALKASSDDRIDQSARLGDRWDHRNYAVITEKTYKTFTVGIDENLDRTIDELKDKFGKTSRADVFRMGIALLKVAADARERDLKLTVSDANDVVKKEIVLP